MLFSKVLLPLAALLSAGIASDPAPHDQHARGLWSYEGYSAKQVIDALDLTYRDDNRYFRRTLYDTSIIVYDRPIVSNIYFLIDKAIGGSYWHRLNGTQVFNYHTGAPLTVYLYHEHEKVVEKLILGPDVLAGQSPQIIIQPNVWQRSESRGKWTLAGASLSPGYVEWAYEVKPKGWNPVTWH
ncbi:RmlC-like cupin domain-containing protein [Stachybotrys elegans]|uniref:RmlC-like cupin domain-containing protein n=1 Tax=Stachybotrys elegans TaxID=80388 RepID=A0A8K0WQX1_9HYPO|nr:RmlC-like cupin domain-containing protein [Stachybotrys elegans]